MGASRALPDRLAILLRQMASRLQAANAASGPPTPYRYREDRGRAQSSLAALAGESDKPTGRLASRSPPSSLPGLVGSGAWPVHLRDPLDSDGLADVEIRVDEAATRLLRLDAVADLGGSQRGDAQRDRA